MGYNRGRSPPLFKVNIDMKRILLFGVAIILIAQSATAAEENRPGAVTIKKQSVSYSAALKIAQEALLTAKKNNIPIAVAVLDCSGIPLVILRADNATEQFVTGATRKAWTSVNLHSSTRALLADIKQNKQDTSQLPYVRDALFLMGGVPLKDGDVIIGGVGVAGAVNGLDDDRFARRAADSFAEMLHKKTK